MGLFGGKNKGKGKSKGRSAKGDAEPGTQRSANRKSRRIAAPSQGGAVTKGTNTRRTSRQVPSKPQIAVPDTPLQLESGEDDVLDNDNLLEPGMAENSDEILLSSSSASKGASVIGGTGDGGMSISHSGDQPLLDFLIHKANMINEEQAEQMRQRAESQDVQIDIIGVQLDFFTEDELVSALTQECWVPHLKVDKYDIRKKALDTIAHEDAAKYSVLPVDKLGGILNLAMVNPLDVEAIRVIESKTGLDIKKVVATRGEIDGGIAKYYGGGTDVASDVSMTISQDLEPQRVTQMLNKVEEVSDNQLAAVEDDGMADIDDLLSADDIDDIGDLIGVDAVAPTVVAPTIIESISVDIADIDDDMDDLEVVEPVIASASGYIELDDMDLDLGKDEIEEEDFAVPIKEPAVAETFPVDAPTIEASVTESAPEAVGNILDLDDTDTDEVDIDEVDAEPVASPVLEEEGDGEFEPSISTIAKPEPQVARSATAAQAKQERPDSMLKKDPATSRFKASVKKPSTKKETVALAQVMEEEFQHAITHSKSHVFEKWSALQTRNRILNAVVVPKELDEVLEVLELNDKVLAEAG